MKRFLQICAIFNFFLCAVSVLLLFWIDHPVFLIPACISGYYGSALLHEAIMEGE